MSSRWLISAIVLLLVITAIWSAAQDKSNNDLAELIPRRTTYNALPSGCKAMLLTLQRCGYQPTRWERSWTDLSSQARILLVLSPPIEPTTEEWNQMLSWVKGGGRLITSPPAGHPDTLATAPAADWVSVSSTLSGGMAAVPQLTVYQKEPVSGDFKRSTLQQEMFPLYSRGPRVVVSYRRLGQGSIVLVRDAEIFSNEGLARAGNLPFTLSLLGMPGPSGSLLFDEFHHGYGYGEEDSLWQHLPTVVRVALMQLGLASLVLLWALSRRTAAPLPEFPPPHQRSEYLDSMAALLERAGALRLVARVRRRAFAERLGRWLHLSNAPSVEQVAILHAEAAAVLRQLETAASVQELCALAERETEIAEELKCK